jgi:hypothetical protein
VRHADLPIAEARRGDDGRLRQRASSRSGNSCSTHSGRGRRSSWSLALRVLAHLGNPGGLSPAPLHDLFAAASISTYPAAVTDKSKQLVRAWTRWAGRGNGPVAAIVERAVDVLLDLGAMFSYSGQGFFPQTIRGRVGAGRRGGYEAVLGAWQQSGRAKAPVTVVLDGEHRFIEGDDFTLPLADVTLLGILDYPTRPRATAPTGTELDYGLVLGTGDGVSALLLHRRDLSVVAILAGWPPPTDLPHGQTITDVTRATA